MSRDAVRGGPGLLRRLDASSRWGLAIVLLIVVLAVSAGPLSPDDPSAVGGAETHLRAPSFRHPLGTDVLGRDVLSRLLHGGRASLIVGWLSVLLAVVLGTSIGLAAGIGPAWLDCALMAATDVFLAFPRIFLILLLVAVATPSLVLVTVVIGITGWMSVARLVRAEALALRERDFVLAARGLELSSVRLAWRHVLPHVLPLVLVAATLRLGSAVLLESFLSYLGLGAQEPLISWGAMIEHGQGHLLDAWWLTAFPGLAITLMVVSYNLLGDGIRDLLDPRGGVRRRGR
ncbi:ABC transporter permease [bacterium]|nr:ABC transporter permease [bacterium]MBU1675510.1 ABC transporter permease [bacterium]